MQLMNVQDNSKRQSVFKERKTQATLREKNVIIMIFQNTSHRNVRNKRNYKASQLSDEDLTVWSDEY